MSAQAAGERTAQPSTVGAAKGAPVPPSLDAVFQHRFAPGAGAGRPLEGELAALTEVRVVRQRPPVSGTWKTLVRFGGESIPRAHVESPDRVASWSTAPPPGVHYAPLPGWATKPNAVAALEKNARDTVAAEGLELQGAPTLGVLRNPGEDAAAFDGRLRKAVDGEMAKRSAKAIGPLDRKIQSLERRIAEEQRELERDRAEKSRAAGYSAIDVGASVIDVVGGILGGGIRRRSVGTGVRSGARAYGRIRKADEDIKESEEKIAAWTRERDALQAEREEALSASRAQAAATAGGLETTRLPVNRSDVRPIEWYVLWS